MITSMTGYAALTREDDDVTVSVSVKTVNHRFLDLQMRVPSSYAELEARVRTLVQQHVSRGRVDLTLSVQLRAAHVPTVELNVEFLTALAAAVESARLQGFIEGPLTPGDVLRMPQAVAVREKGEAAVQVGPAVAAAVERAVDAVLRDLATMRAREGDHLREDLEARRQAIAVFADRVALAAEEGRQGVESRLHDRIKELRNEAPVDETLVAQEVVRFAARSDISEELTRLRGHLAHWLALADGPEPCGRKLDFLLQEMNREVNTIGSKADGLGVSELIIGAKAELEKMREQVANVE